MLSKLKSLFSRKKKIQNFSTTMTTAEEGTVSKAKLNPGIHNIVSRLGTDSKLSNEDLNKLLAYYFTVPPISPGAYNLNKTITDGFVFEIINVNTVLNDNKDVDNIYVTLRELTYNMELALSLSVKEFHEVLKPFNQTTPKPPKRKPTQNVN